VEFVLHTAEVEAVFRDVLGGLKTPPKFRRVPGPLR